MSRNGLSSQKPNKSKILIGDMVYITYMNPFRKHLFIFDKESKTIGELISSELHVLYVPYIKDNISSVISMNYDMYTNSLYWIDYIQGKIEAFHVRKKKRLTLLQNISGLTSMALDSRADKIIFGIRNDGIFTAKMDGSSLSLLRSYPNVYPFVLTYTSQSSLRPDITFNEGEFIKAFYVEDITNIKEIIAVPVRRVYAIARYNQTIYWINELEKILYCNMNEFEQIPGFQKYQKVYSGQKFKRISSFDYHNFKLTITNRIDKFYDFCTKDCDHFCFLYQKRAEICRCANGFSTNDNGKTCFEVKILSKNVPTVIVNKTIPTYEITNKTIPIDKKEYSCSRIMMLIYLIIFNCIWLVIFIFIK